MTHATTIARTEDATHHRLSNHSEMSAMISLLLELDANHGPASLPMQPDDILTARQIVFELCHQEFSRTMSIPVRDGDFDCVLTRVIKTAEASIPAIRHLLAQLAEANEQVKQLSEAKCAMLAVMKAQNEVIAAVMDYMPGGRTLRESEKYPKTLHGIATQALTRFAPFKELIAQNEQFKRSSEATDAVAEKVGEV